MTSTTSAASTTVPHRRIILLCGLPGSGKTTLATRLAERLHAVRLSPDEWLAGFGFDLFDEAARLRVERRLWRHALDLAALGVPVVLENGFWTRQERESLRSRARVLGLEIELRFLDVTLDELLRRLAGRNAEPGAPVITPELLDEYAQLFEPPEPDELALYDPPLPAG
jgi:predicted kinase